MYVIWQSLLIRYNGMWCKKLTQYRYVSNAKLTVGRRKVSGNRETCASSMRKSDTVAQERIFFLTNRYCFSREFSPAGRSRFRDFFAIKAKHLRRDAVLLRNPCTVVANNIVNTHNILINSNRNAFLVMRPVLRYRSSYLCRQLRVTLEVISHPIQINILECLTN